MWSHSDRFSALYAAADRGDRSEDLIIEIVNVLATTGVYTRHVELQPRQGVVDFNWAARQAGERLGLRVDVEMTLPKPGDGNAVFRVTPQDRRSGSPADPEH